ncbi:integrase, catalytic region, zinc finger, CCHC-type containing protein [Tanacetum coccineum]
MTATLALDHDDLGLGRGDRETTVLYSATVIVDTTRSFVLWCEFQALITLLVLFCDKWHSDLFRSDMMDWITVVRRTHRVCGCDVALISLHSVVLVMVRRGCTDDVGIGWSGRLLLIVDDNRFVVELRRLRSRTDSGRRCDENRDGGVEMHDQGTRFMVMRGGVFVMEVMGVDWFDFGWGFVKVRFKLIQELLGYVRDTFPDIHKHSKKLVAVTPINKKTVRSKSTDNTKNDRILQISSSTQKKNKVEDHSRIVKSSLNKSNCVVEPSGNANVQHSKLNTNSELMCVKCNSSMFDARHELCFLEFVSDMNASSKSKSVKKAKKKEEWKPTGKVFTKIGYNWRPTRRTFTLVGNTYPLTRITATNKVPLREPIPLEVIAQESVVTKVYARRPKNSIHLGDLILSVASSSSSLVDLSFLASKDEAPDFIIMFQKMIQVRLNTPVRNIHTDNGTKFVNQTLRSYCESVGISHETSVA